MKAQAISLLFLLTLFCNTGRGQSIMDTENVDPLFQAWGISTFIDVINGPATTYDNKTRFAQPQGFSYFTAAYRARMNLVELFDEMALSSSLTPAMGISFFQDPHSSTTGYLHFNFPMMLNVELGAMATKNSELERFGLVGGIGYEFHAAPLIVNRSGSRLPAGTKLNTVWLQPVYSFGIRYKRRGRIIELNLKYGEESSGTFVPVLGRNVNASSIRVMALYFV